MKIFKLFIDENIKTWKKFSTKLAIFLIFLALIAALGMAKITQNLDAKNNGQTVYYEGNWKEDVEAEIKSYKEQLNNSSLSEFEKKQIENEIIIDEIRIQKNINSYSTNWKNTVLGNMSLEIDEDLLELVINDDFKGYINHEKEQAKKKLTNKEISQAEYDDNISILDLREKYQIGNENTNSDSISAKSYILGKITNEKKSIRTGLNYQNNKVLTAEEKRKYEDDIKINIYKLENNILDDEGYSTDTNYRKLFESIAPSFVMTLTAIFAIIIAGGAISAEVSTGTIKFWALTPNKRWKILTAKILSLLFYLIIISLIMSILSIILANVFFNTSGYEYLFMKDGNVQKIGNTLFTIEYYFVKLIPVIIFAILALMFSTITRNTSLSIGLSLATYMGNSIVMVIIDSYIKKDWVKLIPFNNLNIAEKVFPNFTSMLSMGFDTQITTSLSFALTVLAVCTVLMLVTMYDSFNKRDII